MKEGPIPYDPVEVVVTGLHLRWSGVWQRPNHLLDRIAREIPVLVVEEPLLATRDAEIVERHGNVTVLTPGRAAPVEDALDERTLGSLRELVAGRRPLLWLYTPMMLGLLDAFPGAPVVFDKMDELSKFAQADPRIAPREDALLARADVAFSGGRSLHRTIERRAKTARCYPSGVDVAHFARARGTAAHPELDGRARPVLGYIGVIDERLDLDLIAALAHAFADGTVALVGPVAKIDPATLPRAANIVYLGARGYEELPSLLAAFDVALMPFALNEHTANISPTKTLEYLAAGRPVVSTAVPDVVADHADVVRVARDAGDFIALVREALATREPDRDALARRKAEAATWDAIAASMRDDLAAAGIVYAASAPAPPSPLRSSSAARL